MQAAYPGTKIVQNSEVVDDWLNTSCVHLKLQPLAVVANTI